MDVTLLPAQREFMIVPHGYPRDIALYQGGYGCVSGETLLDTPFGKVAIKDFKGGFIWSYYKGFKILCFATKPKIYDKKPLFEVKTKNGSICCTSEHKFLTKKGFIPLKCLNVGDEVCTYLQNPHRTSSEHDLSAFSSNVLRLLKKVQDFLLSCFVGCRLYDVQPQTAVNTVRDVPNLQKGGQDISIKCNRQHQLDDRLSKNHFLNQSDPHASSKEYCACENIFIQPLLFCLLQALFLLSSFLLQPFLLLFVLFSNRFDTSYCKTSFTNIDSITYKGEDLYYDLHVPLINCYNAQGFVNHNSGKTFVGSLIGILLCLQYAGIRGLVGAQTYTLLRDTTLRQYFEHLDSMNMAQGVHYDYIKAEERIKFKNGSEILFRHLQEPNKLKSLNLGFVELEEMSDAPESTFLMLLSRLRQAIKPEWREKGFKYRLFGHTNPEPNKGWIYKYFVQEKKPNYRLILAPTTQNTFLPADYVESLKAAYDPEYYRINVLGEFGDYTSGLVVKGFSDENVREIHYQQDMTLYLTWDFNVDPMSCVCAHKTKDKVFYFDEFILENASTEYTINEVIKRYPNHKGDIVICGDASGDNRSTQSERTNYTIIRNALRRHYPNAAIRLCLRPYNPPIKNRIASFNRMVKDYNGVRRIFISPNCKEVLYNVYNLKYKTGSDEVDVPSYSAIKTDRRLKFLEHPFDAISYLVEYFYPLRIEDYKKSVLCSDTME